MSQTILTESPDSKMPVVWRGVIGIGPAVILPAIAAIVFWSAPSWQFLWSVALAMVMGLKWMTVVSYPPPEGTSLVRILGYLFAWPGMNAKAFFHPQAEVSQPEWREWLFAAAKLGFGLALGGVAVPLLLTEDPYAAGCAAMIAVLFVLHFGMFHLMSLAWRAAGVDAEPIMQWPILATSVSDFWGRRWNMAFRDLAFTYVLRPLAVQWGTAMAMLVVFFLSGLAHELVITVPVGSWYGGPTAYFLIQALAMLAERSDFGRHWGLGNGITGQIFAAIVVAGPIGLLFPEPFLRLGILPMVQQVFGATTG